MSTRAQGNRGSRGAVQRSFVVLKTPPTQCAQPAKRVRADKQGNGAEAAAPPQQGVAMPSVMGRVKDFLMLAETDDVATAQQVKEAADAASDSDIEVFEDLGCDPDTDPAQPAGCADDTAQPVHPEPRKDQAPPPRSLYTAPDAKEPAFTAPPTAVLALPETSPQRRKRKRDGLSSSSEDGSSSSSSSSSSTSSSTSNEAAGYESDEGTQSSGYPCPSDDALQGAVLAVLSEGGSQAVAPLDASLMRFYEASRLSPQQEAVRTDFFSDLSRRAMGVVPNSELVLFGSSATGLCSRNSDLDVTLLTESSTRDPKHVLQALKNPIGRISRVQFIRGARVPILKCSGRFQFDISCNRPEGGWNAQVIRQFIERDARVAPVLFFVHELFDKLGIKNARSQLLSAFSINVSFIHYLQSVARPSVLPHVRWTVPSLDDDDYRGKVAVIHSNASHIHPGTNGLSAAQLLIGYVDWFRVALQEALVSEKPRWIDIRAPSDVRATASPCDVGLSMVNPVDPTHNITSNIRYRQWATIHRSLERLVQDLTTEGVTDLRPSSVSQRCLVGTWQSGSDPKKERQAQSQWQAQMQSQEAWFKGMAQQQDQQEDQQWHYTRKNNGRNNWGNRQKWHNGNTRPHKRSRQ